MLNITEIKRILFRRIKPPIKFAIRVFRMAAFCCFPIQWETLRVKQGFRCWKQIRELYGSDTHIFFLRGGTGDAYLANALLQKYIDQNGIGEFVLVGNASGLRAVSKLFGRTNVFPINRWKASRLQSLYKVCGPEELGMTDLFMWQHTMYFNRCRIRMEERFTFMDTYQHYVFGFEEPQTLSVPSFCKADEEKKKEWMANGVFPGRTVIISPYAYSITDLPKAFWKELTERLTAQGYKVLFCVDPSKEENPVPSCETYFFSYYESAPLLEFSGAFLGVRSGLCDIISSTKAKMVVLYPNELKIKNYWEHRSDKQFCGLHSMGLNDRAIEIETPLLCNVEIKSEAVTDSTQIDMETKKLLDEIVSVFPLIKQ